MRTSDSSFGGALGSRASFSAHLPRLLNLSKRDAQVSYREKSRVYHRFKTAHPIEFFKAGKLCPCRAPRPCTRFSRISHRGSLIISFVWILQIGLEALFELPYAILLRMQYFIFLNHSVVPQLAQLRHFSRP